MNFTIYCTKSAAFRSILTSCHFACIFKQGLMTFRTEINLRICMFNSYDPILTCNNNTVMIYSRRKVQPHYTWLLRQDRAYRWSYYSLTAVIRGCTMPTVRPRRTMPVRKTTQTWQTDWWSVSMNSRTDSHSICVDVNQVSQGGGIVL